VNSEELELSLKTEFESYLKGFLADMRQEVSEFQKNFESEFEKHKSQTNEAIRKLVGRLESGFQYDRAFNESVVEHLRLARDEGATITAVAIGEAEKLKEESTPVVEFDKIRDAVNDISSKTSQSEILKSLVEHAGTFAPRGAFFIVKNEHFVGWRALGAEATVDEAAVQKVQFAMSEDTVLADAINSLATASAAPGSHQNDPLFLEPLGFGKPDRMYAIPLVARGRGVAVLYADYGSEGFALNPEALETLVRVAGLTVELAAAGLQSTSAPASRSVETVAREVEKRFEEETAARAVAVENSFNAREEVAKEPVATPFVPVAEESHYEAVPEMVQEPEQEFEPGPPASVATETFGSYGEPVEEVTYFEPVEEQPSEPVYSQPEEIHEYIPAPEAEEFPEVIEERVSESVEPVPEVPVPIQPVAELASAQGMRSKYRDRNVDLPIEVPEEERRLHNDARRFARLLVSEIKLYNEQKVNDGRASGDLYDRLREAIDRSREMYDKRVQQAVAEKFDYFHYELVTSLAEGEDVKLGASYPGSRVAA
jgi:hypothetical protein